ncbi:MAG TPA: hypothetical protein VHA52_08750, partial [Candidatus Babeliaceae bacterium]|nr:hypothetical protein [Candidatus Babeliaceae bacterium]
DGSISMFGFRVIVTNKITPGNFILGESNLYKIEEEGVQVRIGYGLSMNGTTPEFDLDYNRFRIIGEIFFHNYISSMHAGSYIYGNFAAIKTALTATP